MAHRGSHCLIRWAAFVLLAGSLFLTQVSEASAARRIALVIGNGGYDKRALKNPTRDVDLMEKTLISLGFKVSKYKNLNQKQMKRRIRDFGEQLNNDTVALFYYSGHGMQVEGQNYLIPIDAEINKESDVDIESVRAESIAAQMDLARGKVNIIILDACRNNPLERSFRRGGTRGLAGLRAAEGTIVAYSTTPGQTADDGDGNYSPYTEALVAEMVKPGLPIELMFKGVRKAVKAATKGVQIPWENSSLTENFTFQNAAAPVMANVLPRNIAAPNVAKPVVGSYPRRKPGTVSKIQWWHAMAGINGERVNRIARDFNAAQSDYEIVPVFKGNYGKTMSAAIAAFRARKQPHIVQVFEVGTATMMAARGAVYAIEDLMRDNGLPFDKSIYLPAVISYYQRPNGDLLSMPFNSSTPVLWYNRDAFRKAGLNPDAPPKTWEEIASVSKRLLGAGMKCGFSFGWQSWVMLENFSAWHNIPFATLANGLQGPGTELTFNNAGVAAMFRQIAAWRMSGIFQYGGRRGESLPKFTKGACGMWLNSSSYYGTIKKQAKFDFGQGMLPLNTKLAFTPQNSIIGGATLWVLKGHDDWDYRGVGQFMNFLSSPKVQAWWHQETGYVPITVPAYELSKRQGFYKRNPGTDMAIRQLRLNKPTLNSMGLRFGDFAKIRVIINEEMEAIWAGRKSARKALDDAARRGNILLRKFERAN